MLHLFRRHYPPCPYKSRRFRRCTCPIWVQGSLRGEWIKKSLNVTSWEAASELLNGWTASGEIGVVKPSSPTVKEAVGKFMEDAEARKLGWEAMRKYRNFLENRFLGWCERKGLRLLKQIDVDALRSFRASWEDGPIYASKNLERLRAFFRFCLQAGWIPTNPALAVKAPVGKPNPTLPFTPQEMKKILKACDRYAGNSERIRAFVLVMRYAGLRIGDTITLKRDRLLNGNKLFLYTQKTGTPVYVPLPPHAVEALNALPQNGEHFFWTGMNTRSAVSNWSRYLASVFEDAKVKDAHSHRFRDTFAVSLLEEGVPLEDVSVLLGHSSIKITERHYKPWVKTLQANLEERVSRTWKSIPASA